MDIKENFEFNQKNSQVKIYLQKDSKLECLNNRIEESCQSEYDSVITKLNPQRNNQIHYFTNTMFQNEELNITVNLNENQNENLSRLKSSGFKYGNHNNNQLFNNTSNNFEQTEFENCQKKIISIQNQNENGQVNNLQGISVQLKSSLPSKEFFFLSKIKGKMKKFFREKTYSGKNFNLQNPKLRILINDKSDIFQQQRRLFQKYCSFIDELTKIIYRLINNIPILNPYGSLKFGLDIVFSLVNCLFFFYSSIIIVFGVGQEFDQQIYEAMYWVWLFQVIVKLNTSFYEKTNLIKNRKAIAKFYLKDHAIWDLFAFLLVFVNPQYITIRKVFKILQFLKLVNVAKKLNDIQISICMSYQNYYIMQLIKLVLKIFLISHIIACLWYLVGYVELEYLGEEKTWFDESIAADRHWVKLYICALYWSLTLMTTGSNIAETSLQISFTSFIMLFTTIVFGYLLNIIGIILSEVDQEEENQRRDMNLINQYMRKRSIGRNLQREINLDLEYYYHHNFKKDDDQNQIVLSKISENLLQNLKKEYFGRFLNKISIISQKFSQETQQKLLLQIEEQNYLPGQVINNYQNYDESRLIYIIQGQVELTRQYSDNSDSNTNIVVASFGKDNLIGQILFFTGIQDGITIKAVDFTQVLSIPRDKFLEIVKENEKDHQIFCNIKDKICQYNDYEDLDIKCEICKNQTHQLFNCPLLHFDKYNQKLKAQYCFSQNQMRKSFNRKNKYFFNTVIRQKFIQDTCKLYNMNNNAQEFYVASPYFNNSESNMEDIFVTEKDLDYYNQNNKTIKSISQIKQEELEENKPTSQEKVKKRRKTLNKRISSQQVCQQIMESQLSSFLYDECNSSDHSAKDKFLTHEPSIVGKLIDGSATLGTQQNQIIQANMQVLVKQFTQQYLQKISKLENLLKGLSGQQEQQVVFAKQINQNSQREITININSDSIIWDFDQKKDYSLYFPNGNSEKVILSYNRQIRRNLMKIQKRKKK